MGARMLSRIAPLRLAALFLIACVSAANAASAADETFVKAGFLANFARFVEWPEPNSGSLEFCVIGDDRMSSYLETSLAGKSIGARRLTVRNQPSLTDLRSCSLIYVGRGGKKIASQVAQSVAGAHILTISEFPELGSQGVPMSFFLDEGRVRFEVHLGAVDRTGLKISSKLLQLARIADKK